MTREEKLKAVRKYRKKSSIILRKLYSKKNAPRQFRRRKAYADVIGNIAKLISMTVELKKYLDAPKIPRPMPQYESGCVMAGSRLEVLRHPIGNAIKGYEAKNKIVR
jgi:hypothetical protein